MPANRRFTLDQIDLITRIGDLKRGLNTRDAAAHDERGRVNRHL
jgi:hypothetical protein